jgi:hypothetical protein
MPQAVRELIAPMLAEQHFAIRKTTRTVSAGSVSKSWHKPEFRNTQAMQDHGTVKGPREMRGDLLQQTRAANDKFTDTSKTPGI